MIPPFPAPPAEATGAPGPMIEAVGVCKQYRQVRAVDDVSLAIRRGSCFGLLGPNGAGKTTLVEIMEDIIRPTAGTVRYKGRPRTARFRQEVGIMFQQTALLSFLTVGETLATFRRLYDQAEPIGDLIRLCRLDEVVRRHNDKLSGGQLQRLLLALALLNRPELIFLDEPSTGLDPQARRNLWALIDTVKSQGRTIILTTHYMEEAAMLCDDIAIMDRGRITARGAPDALIRTHCREATLVMPDDQSAGLRNDLPGTVRVRGGRVEVRTEDVNTLIGRLLERGADMRRVSIRTPSLEDVFLKLTGRRLRD